LSPSLRSPIGRSITATRTFGRTTGGKAVRLPWALVLVILSLFGMLFLTGFHEGHPNMPAAAHAHAGHDAGDSGDADTDNDAGDQLAGHGALHGGALPAGSDLAFAAIAVPVAWHSAAIDLRPSGDPSETLRPPRG